MSMFHELMMRKKEETMYATIKGSLTESPEGVFSGWSLSNYLEIQDLVTFGTKNFELKVCITPSSTNLSRIFCSDESNFTGIYVRSGNFAGSYYDGTTRNIIETTVPYSANTTYYAILYRSGTKIGIKVSTDDVNYTDFSQTISSSTEVVIGAKFIFGINKFGSTYINGSIDLNNSYIKLGSTKYNLQAVVGYTVVGSPTITDGVVSDINASNYLTLPNYSGAYPSGKIAFTYDRQSSMNQILLVMQRPTLFPFRIRAIDRTLQISWVDSDNTQQSMLMSYSLVAGVYYSATWEVKSGKIFFTLFDSLGNILETKNQDISLEATTSGAGKIGWYSTSSYWQGSIDLNNTYIKDGNKLWFNGQQA